MINNQDLSDTEKQNVALLDLANKMKIGLDAIEYCADGLSGKHLSIEVFLEILFNQIKSMKDEIKWSVEDSEGNDN